MKFWQLVVLEWLAVFCIFTLASSGTFWRWLALIASVATLSIVRHQMGYLRALDSVRRNRGRL